jgi:hypothetical protein
MAATLHELGFKNCLADLDVYLQPNVKPCGTNYYEYVLVYVDDVLVVSHDPQDIMNKLGKGPSSWGVYVNIRNTSALQLADTI